MRAWWAILLLLPSAAAEPQLLLTHDVPDDGTTFLGNVDRFGFVLTDDGTPLFHQDVHFEVVQGNTTLLSLTRPAGHDYDALGSFLVAFPNVGPYEVRATWRDESAVFRGEVLPPPATNATLVVDGPGDLAPGEPATFTYSLQADGIVAHTDILVQVLDAHGREVLRTQTHTHAADQAFGYRFPAAGDYTVRFTGFKAFPTPDAFLFPSVVAEHRVTVPAEPDPLVPDVLGLLQEDASPAPPMPENRVVEGSQGPLRLIGTYDPYTSVGTGQAMRLGAVVVAEDGRPAAHTDFKATLTGPDGVVFQSDTLHEYDGVFEFLDRRDTPGDYALRLEASRGEWSDAIEMPYQVREAAMDPGAPELTIDATDMQGCGSQTLGFAAFLGGQRFQHSEVAFTITDAAGRTVRDGKLHTHDSGAFDVVIGGLPTSTYTVFADVQDTNQDRSDAPAGRAAQTSFAVTDCAPVTLLSAKPQAETTPLPVVVALGALLVAARSRR